MSSFLKFFSGALTGALITVSVFIFWPIETGHEDSGYTAMLRGVEREIAEKCSIAEKCTAIMNDGDKFPLQMVGDNAQTWIVLGNQKLETQDFLKKIYNSNTPKGVATIDGLYR